MRTATIRTYLFDGGRLRLFGVEPTGPPDGGPALVALIGRAAGARVADTQVDTPKLRIFRRIGGDGPAEAIFDGHLAGSCSRARRGGWSCSTPQQSRVLGLPEALTAKGSTEGQQLGPCCVGLVAGHRAGTSTDRKASPALPVEKRYARGKDSRRAQRRQAVWMQRSRLGATCARTARERGGASPTGRRGWVIHTKLGRL